MGKVLKRRDCDPAWIENPEPELVPEDDETHHEEWTPPADDVSEEIRKFKQALLKAKQRKVVPEPEEDE